MEPETKIEQDGDEISKDDNIVDKANDAAITLKAENDRFEQLLQRQEALAQRQEALAARRILGGTTTGADEEEKPKEETDKEYLERIEREGL